MYFIVAAIHIYVTYKIMQIRLYLIILCKYYGGEGIWGRYMVRYSILLSCLNDLRLYRGGTTWLYIFIKWFIHNTITETSNGIDTKQLQNQENRFSNWIRPKDFGWCGIWEKSSSCNALKRWYSITRVTLNRFSGCLLALFVNHFAHFSKIRKT